MLLNPLLRDEPSGVIINEANWSIRGSQLFIQQTVCVKVSASINNSEGVGVVEDAASVLDTDGGCAVRSIKKLFTFIK